MADDKDRSGTPGDRLENGLLGIADTVGNVRDDIGYGVLSAFHGRERVEALLGPQDRKPATHAMERIRSLKASGQGWAQYVRDRPYVASGRVSGPNKPLDDT